MMFERKLMGPFKMLLVFSLCFSLVFAVSLTGNDTKRMIGLQQPKQQPEQQPEKHQVLILGAGIAGITAAKTLHDAGITDFLVLEASYRIGGRLLVTPFGGGAVELGANWVHGTKNNPIWDLVKKAGLKGVETMIEPTEGKYTILDQNGNDVTKFGGNEELASLSDCFDKFTKDTEKKEEDASAQDQLNYCGWFSNINPAKQVVEYFYYDFEAAVPPEKISCGAMLNRDGKIDSAGGAQVLISDTRGYETIVTEMAGNFLDKIRKKQLVKKITLNKDFVQVDVIGEMKQFKANRVLVTFSIGVLQANLDSMFQLPSLPPQFRESLKKIEIANYLKIFLKFNKRFWPKEFDYILYASQTRGFYPVWQNLPGTLTGIPANDNVLLVTVTGQKAWELKDDAQLIIKELLPVLQKVFDIEVIDEPEIVFKNWGIDPLFLGTYSNPTVRTTSADFENLLSPIRNRLYFAGEGLSELYYGYAHGAYLTGQKQANKIKLAIQYEIAQENRLRMLEQNTKNRAVGLNYLVRKTISKPENNTEY